MGRLSSVAGISLTGREEEFHLGASINLAPDRQLAPNERGAFPHTWQPIMEFFSLAGKNRRLDSFSIGPHT